MSATLTLALAPSFDAFYEEERAQLFRTMVLVTGDPAEAEELCQEAFVRVYERWERVSRMERPGGYLVRTAMNLHRSALRRLVAASRRRQPLPAGDAIEQADERDVVRVALQRLPLTQRQVVVLIEWLQLSAGEAARILGTSTGAVRVRLSRARASLRRMLEVTDD